MTLLEQFENLLKSEYNFTDENFNDMYFFEDEESIRKALKNNGWENYGDATINEMATLKTLKDYNRMYKA